MNQHDATDTNGWIGYRMIYTPKHLCILHYSLYFVLRTLVRGKNSRVLQMPFEYYAIGDSKKEVTNLLDIILRLFFDYNTQRFGDWSLDSVIR
jgi:hypothetical protein